ncbi:hypothetical protein CLAIMM_10689, partial [Cladophialophora immunda]
AASARAREDITERIGFSSQRIGYAAAVATGKLTVDEMNLYDMRRHVAEEAAPERRSRSDVLPRDGNFIPVTSVSRMPEQFARM